MSSADVGWLGLTALSAQLGSCLAAFSTQVGYIVPWMYEIYIV